MKILVVHNDYGKPSGEEAVVDRFLADAAALGHEVQALRRSSRGSRERLWGRVHGFFAGIYCREGVRAMRQALQRFRPDVVNVHNLYPFLSPAVLHECRKAGVPVVMTVHNYRLVCPTGLLLRHDSPCEQCLAHGNEWPCLLHNCERSLPRSLGYAARNAFARRRRYYLDLVDCYCCLTAFQRDKLVAAGFAREKIAVIPNYTSAHEEPRNGEKNSRNKENEPCDGTPYIGYVGRLSREKGYDLLLAVARRRPQWPVRLAGEVRDALPPLPDNATLCGNLPPQALADFYRNACCIVFPSRCYEGLPVAMLEAFAAGKPCIAPRHGAFPQLIGEGKEACGLLFAPNDTADLERAIAQLLHNDEARKQMGENARRNALRNFSRETVLAEWEALLQRVTAGKKAYDETSSL